MTGCCIHIHDNIIYLVVLSVVVNTWFTDRKRMKLSIWLPVTLFWTAGTYGSQSQSIYQNILPQKDIDQYGLALEAIFSIGLRLRALSDSADTHNFVISPLSATMIVGQLLLGAKGEFSDQLYDLLSLPGQPRNYNINTFNKSNRNETVPLPYANIHLQLSSLLKKLLKNNSGEAFILSHNNALFYNQNIELKRLFSSNMIRFYHSEITPLDFTKDTSRIINDWASSHTNGLIRKVLPQPLGPTTSGLFLNSIYFLAEWETPFSDTLNHDDGFYITENKTVVTTYMMGMVEEIPYVETKDYRLICLPYKNNELGMYILIPTKDSSFKFSLKEFSEKLNPVEVLEGINKAPLRDVVVKIPKLSLSNTLGLLEPLQKYAEFKKTNKNTSSNANSIIENIGDNIENYKNFTAQTGGDILLSGAAKNADFKVSDIIQQMVFSINEKGTEAASVTAGVTDYMGGSKTVILNRPFSFFIRHEATLATIFWGHIVDPSQH